MLHTLLQLGGSPKVAVIRYRESLLPSAFARMLFRAGNLTRLVIADISEDKLRNIQIRALTQLGRDLACLTAFVRGGANVNLSALASDPPTDSDDEDDQHDCPWWTDPTNGMSFVQMLKKFQTDVEENDQELAKAAVRNAFTVEEDTAGLKTVRCHLPEKPELDEWIVGEYPSCANYIMDWIMGWLDQVPEEGRTVAGWLWRSWRLVDGKIRMIAPMPRSGNSVRVRSSK